MLPWCTGTESSNISAVQAAFRNERRAMNTMLRNGFLFSLAAASLGAVAANASATDTAPKLGALRVCADPSNMPH